MSSFIRSQETIKATKTEQPAKAEDEADEDYNRAADIPDHVIQSGGITSYTKSTQLTGVNRLLGATAGPADGNVRAIIAIILTLSFVVFCFFALWAFVQNQNNGTLKTLLLTVSGSLVSAFTLAIGFYWGTRAAQTSGN